MVNSTICAASPEDKFCGKEGEKLTENADGSATCVAISEGTFADLKFDEGDSKPAFTVVSPGVVRASFPTKDMAGDLGKDNSDPQAAAMSAQPTSEETAFAPRKPVVAILPLNRIETGVIRRR